MSLTEQSAGCTHTKATPGKQHLARILGIWTHREVERAAAVADVEGAGPR